MYLPPSLLSEVQHVFVGAEIEVSMNQAHSTVNPPEFEAEEFELNSESSLNVVEIILRRQNLCS